MQCNNVKEGAQVLIEILDCAVLLLSVRVEEEEEEEKAAGASWCCVVEKRVLKFCGLIWFCLFVLCMVWCLYLGFTFLVLASS